MATLFVGAKGRRCAAAGIFWPTSLPPTKIGRRNSVTFQLEKKKNMRLNENTKITGQRVILVPYKPKHVRKYHEWMQDPILQELTASEPLSLEDEYKMQKCWREDDDKLTFLVLSREKYEEAAAAKSGGDDSEDHEILALIGDTNLFLREDEHEGRVAEVEIMIAEQAARGKGYGWESSTMLLKYAVQFLGIKTFEAKIGIENDKSLRMFEKMKFVEVGRSEVFREVTLNRTVTEEWKRWIDAEVSLQCEQYSITA